MDGATAHPVTPAVEDIYLSVELRKPLGLELRRGVNNSVFVKAVHAESNAAKVNVEVGMRVLAVATNMDAVAGADVTMDSVYGMVQRTHGSTRLHLQRSAARRPLMSKAVVHKKQGERLGVILKSEPTDMPLHPSLLRVHFVTEGGAFHRSFKDSEGNVILAVNGDCVHGMELRDATSLIRSCGDTFVLTMAPYEMLLGAHCREELIAQLASARWLTDADPQQAAQQAQSMSATELLLRAGSTWRQVRLTADMFGEPVFERLRPLDAAAPGAGAGELAGAWETPVKAVSKDNFVAPFDASEATPSGTPTCGGCGARPKDVLFGCGHCMCGACADKCHACPVKGCGRLIMNRTKLDAKALTYAAPAEVDALGLNGSQPHGKEDAGTQMVQFDSHANDLGDGGVIHSV